jgi:hypothetical protein
MQLTKFFRAYGLIRKFDQGQTSWLVVRQPGKREFDLVYGNRVGQEPFSQTISKAVATTLRISAEKDVLVSGMAQLNMEYHGYLPGEIQMLHVAVAFYPVTLFREEARSRIETDPHFRWLSSVEMCAGRSHLGEQINLITTHLINKFEIIQGWDAQGSGYDWGY